MFDFILIREAKGPFKKQIQVSEKYWEMTEAEKDIITEKCYSCSANYKCRNFHVLEHIAGISVYPGPQRYILKTRESFSI